MRTRNWIGGEWRIPGGGEIHATNPSNIEEELGVISLSQTTDVLEAGDAARRALPSWSGKTGAGRAEILLAMAEKLVVHQEELAILASSEMGKPILEMKGEVMRGIQILRYYAAEGVRAVGHVIPASENNVLQYTKRVPLGVVGIITPWNFPVAIPIWKIAPALICGNTIIWKPAENASLTATRLTELFETAHLPGGVFNLLVGKGRAIGSTLLEEAELDGVSFTGSTETGRGIAVSCAKRNIKYQTEMGGKNAAVVLHDANLEQAVPAIISGAFRSAGQKCTATSRIIVERQLYEPLAEALSNALFAVNIGSALDFKSYLGPLCSREQHEKVSSYVQMAHQETRIIGQGQATVDTQMGHYILPIIATDVDVDHPLIQEEIFGPVATLIAADNYEETLAYCNKSMYGLSASIFTKDISKAMHFLEVAECGMVRVNLETAGVEYQAPFGGMKGSSSHTREQGQSALDFYSQTKTCAIHYGSPT